MVMEKPSKANGEEKKFCLKCKQRRNSAKNCPKMADTFFVGMALGTEDNDIPDDLHSSSTEDEDLGNELILWMDVELEARCMMSQDNWLCLEKNKFGCHWAMTMPTVQSKNVPLTNEEVEYK